MKKLKKKIIETNPKLMTAIILQSTLTYGKITLVLAT